MCLRFYRKREKNYHSPYSAQSHHQMPPIFKASLIDSPPLSSWISTQTIKSTRAKCELRKNRHTSLEIVLDGKPRAKTRVSRIFGSHPNRGLENRLELDKWDEAPARVENPEGRILPELFSLLDAGKTCPPYLPGQTCLNRLQSAEGFSPFESSSTIKALISAVQAFNSSRKSRAGSLDSI